MKRTLISCWSYIIVMFFAMTSCSGEKEGSTTEEFGLAETWVAHDKSEMNIVSKNFYEIDGMRTVMAILYVTNEEFGKELSILEFAIHTPDSGGGKDAPNFAPDIQSLEIKNNEGETLSVPVFFHNNMLFIKVSAIDYETAFNENTYAFTFLCYAKEISIKTKLNNGKEYTWKFNSFVESKQPS